MSEDRWPEMTSLQVGALAMISYRYKVPFDPRWFGPSFDLPDGWVSGCIGGPDINEGRKLFVGCDPDGNISS